MNELMHLGGLSLIRRRGKKTKKTKKLKEIARVVCSGVMMLCGTVPVLGRAPQEGRTG